MIFRILFSFFSIKEGPQPSLWALQACLHIYINYRTPLVYFYLSRTPFAVKLRKNTGNYGDSCKHEPALYITICKTAPSCGNPAALRLCRCFAADFLMLGRFLLRRSGRNNSSGFRASTSRPIIPAVLQIVTLVISYP